MDPEEARSRFENEGMLIILNIPSSGLHIITDGSQNSIMVNEKFKGFKMIPCHRPHLITLRPLSLNPDTDTNLTHSSLFSLFAIFKSKEFVVVEWISDEEVFRISRDEDLVQSLHVNRYDLDPFLAIYPFTESNSNAKANTFESLITHLDTDTFGKMFKRGPYLFNSLSDLREEPNQHYPFTTIPTNKELLTSGLLTSLHDKSALLTSLFPSFKTFLAQLQCSFVMAIICLNFECLTQWASLITLLSSCPLFIENNPYHIDSFLTTILPQLDPSNISAITSVNIDEFRDLIMDCDASHKLFSNLAVIIRESSESDVAEELKSLLKCEYGFSLEDNVLSDDENPPVVVQSNY